MKRFKLILVLLSLLTVLTAFAAEQSEPMVFSSPDKGIIVQSKHPEFTLTLQSNATTGYSWFLSKYDNKLMTPVSHKYVAPNSKLMGAGGYEVWVFKVAPAAFTVPQTMKVVMEYARPWEKGEGTKSVFKVYAVK